MTQSQIDFSSHKPQNEYWLIHHQVALWWFGVPGPSPS